MILEINVGIQLVSLTDGAFNMIITMVLHTTSLMSCPAIAPLPLTLPSTGYYHANLKEKTKKIHFSE